MKVNIDIYSGFLGAGKTMLIKKLIKEGHYEREIAIIENEFGEVSIDGAILRDSNIEVKEINSGCICCQVKGDFKKAILEVIEKYNPSRIIIEPSGVAKLTDIIKVFKDKELKEKTKVENIITVVDPEKFSMYIENFKEFYKDQILNTKKVVLSRTQKLNKEKIEGIVLELKRINSRVSIITDPWDKVDGDHILEGNKYSRLNIRESNGIKVKLNKNDIENKSADEVFETFAIYPNSKISKAELVSKFKFISASKSYGDVLRAKGIIKLLDGSNGQFDFVKDEFQIREIKEINKSVISFIGINLNKEEIKSLFK
ncbi:CobW family GTP-binding protein [Clostridium sp. MB05]|jgi:G3E family GTPase|uniref:CobW family GTP-binding protein n=1 Tax=Clostridium sp. MB05 TaxID=3376682 RepID=UPI003981C79A